MFAFLPQDEIANMWKRVVQKTWKLLQKTGFRKFNQVTTDKPHPQYDRAWSILKVDIQTKCLGL